MRGRSASRRGSGRRTELQVAESLSERPLDSTGLSGYSPGVPGAVSDALTTNASLTAARETRSDGDGHAHPYAQPAYDRGAVVHAHELPEPGLTAAGSQIGSVRLERRVSPSGIFHAGYGFGSASFATAESEAGRPARHRPGIRLCQAASVFRPHGARDGNRLDAAQQRPQPQASPRPAREPRARPRARDGPRESSTRARCSSSPAFRSRFCRTRSALNVDGQMGRDWFLTLSGGVARGSVGFTTGASRYDSYNTSARVYRQIARAWRVEAEAFSTRFRFDGESPAGALPPRIRAAGRAPRIVVVGCVVPEEIEVFRVTRTQVRNRRFSADRMARQVADPAAVRRRLRRDGARRAPAARRLPLGDDDPGHSAARAGELRARHRHRSHRGSPAVAASSRFSAGAASRKSSSI